MLVSVLYPNLPKEKQAAADADTNTKSGGSPYQFYSPYCISLLKLWVDVDQQVSWTSNFAVKSRKKETVKKKKKKKGAKDFTFSRWISPPGYQIESQ